jgi:hypothetical protein
MLGVRKSYLSSRGNLTCCRPTLDSSRYLSLVVLEACPCWLALDWPMWLDEGDICLSLALSHISTHTSINRIYNRLHRWKVALKLMQPSCTRGLCHKAVITGKVYCILWYFGLHVLDALESTSICFDDVSRKLCGVPTGWFRIPTWSAQNMPKSD